MVSNKVFKCNIIAKDHKKINEFLSHPIFSKNIINPLTNVGIIQTDTLVLQVQVIPERQVGASRQLQELSYQKNLTFELADDVDSSISEIKSFVNELEEGAVLTKRE